jgi:hypothetical protein
MNRKDLLQSIMMGFIIGITLVTIFTIVIVRIELEIKKNHYLSIMKNLNQPETKKGLRILFERDYNYKELLFWEKDQIEFSWENIERRSNPLEILEYGKGRCEEFSILYVGLCLAHGYQSRLVVDIYGDHVWAEVKIDNSWIHVDTEGRFNDPYMYERDWGKKIDLIYAFEDGYFEDVTPKYKMSS